MMKLSVILIKLSSLAILYTVSADQISGNSRIDNNLDDPKVIVKRSNGWGLPIMFHSIIPGKISSKKRELREAARNGNASASEQDKSSQTKSRSKDKQTESEPKQNEEPSIEAISSEPSSSSHSSLKKKNKKRKDLPSSFTASP